MKQTGRKRAAFTLIELLVAVGIIAMLLGLVAISFPRFNEREQLTRAVDKLRTGLLTARLWAKRDQVVTGIQFLKSSNPSAMVQYPKGTGSSDYGYYGFTYVQQPLVSVTGVLSSDSLINTKTAYLSTSTLNKIQPKDYLVVSGDVPHQISSISLIPNPNVTLGSSFQQQVLNGTNFRIIHAPVSIPMQEETLFLPDSLDDPSLVQPVIFIHKATANLNNDSVLFLPSGNVINQGSGSIRFLMCQSLADPNSDYETADVFLDCMSGTNRYISPN